MTEIIPSTTTPILQVGQLGSREGRTSAQVGVQLGWNPEFLIRSLLVSRSVLSLPSPPAPETYIPLLFPK